MNKNILLIGLIASIILIAGCTTNSDSTQTIANLLQKSAFSDKNYHGMAMEIPAGTVIDNIELARLVGISYTELGFYADEETGLVDVKTVDNISDHQIIRAPKTVRTFVEADCSNVGKTYEGLRLYDCMVRFKPY